MLLLAGTTIPVCAFTVNGINYNIISEENLTAEVGRNSGFGGEAIIPETVEYKGKQYSVTSIGRDAFSGCSGLTSVTIPNSVTSIGEKAFYGTAWFDNQPDGLVYAGKVAYRYKGTMPENTSISLKEGTLGIADFAFSYCYTLTSIVIPNSVTNIGQFAFELCSLGSVTIPNSVTSIGRSAFFRSGLGSVTIPNSVTSIGNNAFGYCGLISIVVESGNTRYDSRDNCNAIIEKVSNILIAGCKNTIIPNSVTSIGDHAFSLCSGLTSITIPNSVTSIGESAFYGCPLTSMTIPNSVTSIGKSAFKNCSKLTNVTIGNSVTSIGDWAFDGCSGLTSVTIGNSVTSIGRSAFSFCKGLTSVTIPNSVTSIGNRAFHGCSGLTSIIVESGNTKYDSRNNCNAIIEKASNTLIAGCKNTIIPNSVTSIGGYTFYGCYGLTSVTIPNSVTSIGDCAFYDCSKLTNVTIGNSVTSIGDWAFDGCSGLTSVTIGNSVTSIGRSAFSNCSGLTEVISLITDPFAISDNCWSRVNTDKIPLYVPLKTKEKYEAAAGWNFKNIIEWNYDEDNVLALSKQSSIRGAKVVLPIGMKNDAEITAIQFDLYLPAGVSIAKDEDGEELIDLGSRTTARKHSLAYREQEDGAMRVVCNSMSNAVFSGNEGTVLNVTLSIAADLADGDYTIMLKNIELSDKSGTAYNSPTTSSTLSIKPYLTADVDYNGKVTVNDAVCIVNHILGEPNTMFVEAAADLDGSGTISVNDVVVLVNDYILGGASAQAVACAPAMASESDASYLYIDDLTMKAGETMEVEVLMQTDRTDIKGLQCDVYLPDGVEFAYEEEDGERYYANPGGRAARSHTVAAKIQDDGALRVVETSTSGAAFKQNSQAVFTFTIKASGNMAAGSYAIRLANMELSYGEAINPSERSSQLNITANTTEIDSIDNGKLTIDNWYSVDGVKLNGEPRKKGLYIRNGKKVVK